MRIPHLYSFATFAAILSFARCGAVGESGAVARQEDIVETYTVTYLEANRSINARANFTHENSELKLSKGARVLLNGREMKLNGSSETISGNSYGLSLSDSDALRSSSAFTFDYRDARGVETKQSLAFPQPASTLLAKLPKEISRRIANRFSWDSDSEGADTPAELEVSLLQGTTGASGISERPSFLCSAPARAGYCEVSAARMAEFRAGAARIIVIKRIQSEIVTTKNATAHLLRIYEHAPVPVTVLY